MKAARVAIVGYGVEGQAAYKYWKRQGADVSICDANTRLELPQGARARLGKQYLQGLEDYDLVVRSPGVRPSDIPAGAKVTSVTREFLQKCPAPVIGVTGTKGKGTTATLIAKILEAGGCRVWLGGNIGRPAVDFLDQVKPDDYVVLELSSFQLIDVEQSVHIGVVLMVVSEHMDYHRDMTEYVEAKANLVRYQNPRDLVVYHGSNMYSVEIANLSEGRRRRYAAEDGCHAADGWVWFEGRQICRVSDVGLLGPHNLENVCAAVAATAGLVDDAAIARAVKAFDGLPHRLELVHEVGGVRYYDDSFSTTPETAIAAAAAFAQPKILILGGSAKGSAYDGMADVFAKSRSVRRALLIGATAGEIAQALERAGFDDFEIVGGGMPEIVAAAQAAAKPGDVVLLSPACASFDMFDNYKQRGEKFQAAVSALKS